MQTPRITGLAVWLARLKAELMSDRRKTAVLGVLAAVALVLTMRLLLGRHIPKRAIARPGATAASRSPSGGQRTAGAEATAQSALPERLVEVDTRIERDLFRVDAEAYPLLPEPARMTAGPAVSPAVDEALRLREDIRKKAAKLVLQSTVDGPRPTAIINGRVVALGERILGHEEFVVQSIAGGTCVVTCQDVAVRLEIKRP